MMMTLRGISIRNVIEKVTIFAGYKRNVKSASKFISFALGLLKIDGRSVCCVL
jgi:hypothetical protein